MSKTPKSPEQLRVDSLIETIQQHPTKVLQAEHTKRLQRLFGA